MLQAGNQGTDIIEIVFDAHARFQIGDRALSENAYTCGSGACVDHVQIDIRILILQDLLGCKSGFVGR